MLWFFLVTLLIVGGTLWILPTISRPTVPLGVSVPSARVADPVVVRSVRMFRLISVISTLVAIAGMWAMGPESVTAVWWILGLVGAGTVAFALCRRPIMAAKAAQGWYAGVRVRVGASVQPEAHPGTPWGLYAVGLGVMAAATAALVVSYPSLPDPFPVHWDAAGRANRFEPKSWTTVLSTPTIGLATVVVLALVGWALGRRLDPRLPDGHPETAQRVASERRHSVRLALGWIALGTSLVLGFATVLPLLPVPSGVTGVVIWLPLPLVLAPSIWLIVRTVRAQRAAREAPGVSGAESPDDDRYWKLGQFYYHPGDPSLLVEKRAGIGYTLNLGHPVGMAIVVATALLLAGLITVAAVSG